VAKALSPWSDSATSLALKANNNYHHYGLFFLRVLIFTACFDRGEAYHFHDAMTEIHMGACGDSLGGLGVGSLFQEPHHHGKAKKLLFQIDNSRRI